ncbi:imidazolonepropionase-like amidohydrolase [Amycolatopsis bartoniae]|uniref:Amidohydrolase n=1 Tax=Amycolatopsis bartoniae TaxID=941986 RepID=A0A8H9MFA9_9PSEU|nr:amidohydrolase family protein [Amycolatopsis bartoniae]MBB2938572.1 imidazolonepropionase-like amidohydrolase [Amycolatopsis bartoniae]TVT08924.1 amidohydrolase family protein [Amycolatopsis bartoniae]GHF70043.1 amidohydrolase [Amycolatopsis bartoniae]
MESVYFTGGTVVTCVPGATETEAVLAGATVEVNGDVIVGVGDLEIARSATRHDLRGRYLMPGLWDAHVHLGGLVPPHDGLAQAADPRHQMARCIAKAQDNLRHGVTSVRSLGEQDGTDLLLRDLIASGVVRGPRVYASGDVQWSSLEAGVDNVRRHVRERVFADADQIKLLLTGGIPYPGPVTTLTMRREELEAAITEAHAWDRPVAVHAMGDEAVRMAIECGADTIEHAFACSPELAKIFVRDGLTFCPTLVVTATWTPESLAAQGLPDWMAANAEATREGHHELFAAVAELGGTVCAGVDNLPRRGPHDLGIEQAGELTGLVRELELMVGLGLSTLDALRAATVNAAATVGAAHKVGTIEAGRTADFLVLDQNPLADIRALREVAEVWQAGVRVH